ncbi:MAG: hypothetical protein HY040_15480 [Planctomycetes bacterium]|nr:hypothetical protein [Planctomycetota bacterium]
MRRIVIPAARLQAEVERARPGVLVQLARPEFEAMVQRAAGAREALKNPPRLVKASYSADLERHAIVGGGQWTVLHAGPGPGVVPLGGLNLALSKVKSAGGSAAVLGDLNPSGPGLLVEKSGEQSFFFDWSLRGAVVPNGLKFDIQVPASPVSVLELKLPADHVVLVLRGEALLTGPHDAESPGKRMWRLQFTGRAQAEILVRRFMEPELMPPLLLAQVQNKQRITPSRVGVEIEFNLEILHAVLNELVFDCDPSLQPLEVACRNADILSWEHAAGDPARLTVKFRGAMHGPLQGLRIRCQTPREPEEKPWLSPWMRLRESSDRAEHLKVVMRGENLQVVVDPDVNMERWSSGDFRLASTTTDANGAHVLSLNSPGKDAGPTRRPSALFRSNGFDLLVQQETLWQIRPREMTLKVNGTYELHRGSLFHLALRLPEGAWRVADVQVEPAEVMRTWSAAGPMLLVELQRGMTPRNPIRLNVRLTRESDWGPSAQVLSLPDLIPVDATLRRGAYAINLDPVFRAVFVPSTASSSSAELEGPGPSPSTYSFLWREKPVSGQLRVMPQKSKLRARCRQEASLGSSHGDWTARLDVEPVLGSPSFIDLLISAPIDGGLAWSSDGGSAIVRRVERLSLEEVLPGLLALGPQSPFERVFCGIGAPRFQRWRLHLQNPLEKGETILVKARLAPEIRRGPELETHWDIPVLVIPEADKLDGQIKLWGAGLLISKTRGRNLAIESELGAGIGMTESFAAPYHEFRYEADDRVAIPSLSVWTTPQDVTERGQTMFDSVQLATQLESGTTCLHHLRFDVWNWPGGDLPVRLPATTSKVLAVKLNGRWLENLAIIQPAEAPLVLPVAASKSRQVCEIAYATETPRWLLGCEMKGMLPRLPARAAVVRHVLRLPPGIIPLDQGAWQPAFGESANLSPHQTWQFGSNVLEAVWPGITKEKTELQRQAILGADAVWRKKDDTVTSLGVALRQLSLGYLQNQLVPLIDLEGLRTMGLSPKTPLPVEPAKTTNSILSLVGSLDIVTITIPGGILLTTRSRHDVWQNQVETNESVKAALLEAKTHGQDGLGRFASLSAWLLTQCPTACDAGSQEEIMSPLVPDALPPGWTQWQQVPGGAAGEVNLVAAAPVRFLGLVLAGVLLTLSWQLRRFFTDSWRIRLLALVLCCLGAAVFVLPIALRPLAGFPLGLVAALVVCWYVRVNRRPADNPIQQASSNRAIMGSAAVRMLSVLLTVAVILPSARTGEPEPYPIWIVESVAGSQQVFVSPELLKKLSEMERIGGARADTVLVSAAYQGKTTGQVAEFTAQYEIYSFADKAVLTVPLANIDLREGSYLDGAPVLPVAVSKPRSGYQVPVQGKGFHRLTLAFAARTTTMGEAQELTFTGPSLFQNEFEFVAPISVRDLHLSRSVGEEKLTASSGRMEVRANLGRGGLVRATWRKGESAAAQATIEVRESHFWDLRPGSLSLSAALHYDVGKASVDRLTVALPLDFEVRSVDAGGTPAGGTSAGGTSTGGTSTGGTPAGGTPAGATEPILKTWRLVSRDGARTLMIELARPASGRFTIVLGLIPRFDPAGSSLLLRLPTPQEGKQVEGFLAYRLDNADAAEKAQNLGLTSLAPELFGKHWSAAGLREIGPVTRAFSFRRSGAGAALALALSPVRPQATQEATWIVSSSHADFSADIKIVSSSEDLSLIELTVPPALTLAEIKGAQVHHWTRQDAVTQIWLRQPRKQATLHVTGWAKLPQPAVAGKPGHFVIPMLGVQKARLGASVVKVSEATGITVEVERLRSMTRLPGSKGGVAFAAQAPDSEAALVIRQAAAAPAARALSTVEQRGKSCEFLCQVQLRELEGKHPPFTLHVREFASEKVVLQAPPGVVTGYTRRGDDHAWTIAIAPGVPQPVILRLQGRFVANPTRKWTMPRLALEGARLTDCLVGLVGPNLHSVLTEEMSPVAEPAKELSAEFFPSVRPGAADTFWRLSGSKSRLVFEMSAPNPSVEVLLAEQEAFFANDARWVHQAHLLIFAGGDGSFYFSLPQKTELLALAVDGSFLDPSLIGVNRYGFALDGAKRARRVDIRWQYLDGAEEIDHPKLEPLTVPGELSLPAYVRLVLPFSRSLRVDRPQPSDVDSRAIFENGKATVRLSNLLSPLSIKKNSSSIELLQAQKQFAWLNGVAHAAPEFYSSGPKEGMTWAAAWADLSRENVVLAKEYGWDSVRTAAESDPTPQWPRCELAHALGVSHDISADGHKSAVTLRVDDLASSREKIAWRRCELLAFALTAFLVFSFMPRGLALLARLWPEQLVLLGCLGMWVWGPSPIGFSFVALGVAGRLFWCMRLLSQFAATYVLNSPAAGSVPSKG